MILPPLVRSLIKQKRLKPFRGYYLVAVDGSGITTYDEKQRDKLLHKESGKGKETYLNIMLEAKIVTPERLSVYR